MEKLGVFDQLFYKADKYQVATMIMGGASILAPAKKGGRLNARAIADHLGARLGKIPLMRVKLVQDQLRLGSMYKIQDPTFDIDDHINVIALPRGADYAELSECLAQQSAIPLDLPNLWRWTVIEGLKGGKVAIFCKVHHALADGVGLVEALSSIYNPQPVQPEKLSPAVFEEKEQPGHYQLLRTAVAESASRLMFRTPRFIARNAVPILTSAGNSVRERWAARNDPDSSFAMPEVSPTSLNTSEYSGRRAVAWKTLSLPEIKTLARHFDCKVNDIGLLLYSWAMQHYFANTGEDIDFDLWCAMPMSTRTSTSGEGGNQVTVARLSLHNTLSDPLERLRAINQDALRLKQTMRPEQPLIDIEELADLVFPTVVDGLLYLSGKLNLLGRLGGRFALANALFSNVPGPPSQVCVANAVMVESIPMIPAVDVLAVSGGITSVDQAITIGFHCDGGVVENPGLFLEGIDAGMAALNAAMKEPGE